MEVTSRQCTGCGKTKSLDCFGLMKGGRYGRRAMCKVCRKRYKYNGYDPVKRSAYMKQYNRRPDIVSKKQEYAIRIVRDLTDTYVADQVSRKMGIPYSVAASNKELLNAYKQIIKIKRYAKES